MKILKEIFVPYEIALKLKGIGFNEDCMFRYLDGNLSLEVKKPNYSIESEDIRILNYNLFQKGGLITQEICSAPTWEQVKKWFREKNYQASVTFNFGSFYGYMEHTIKAEAYATEYFKTYEEAQEKMILELIEIYKKTLNKWNK